VTPGIGRTNGHYPEPSDFSTTTTNAEDDARPGAFNVGTERGYWKRLEHVQVGLITEKEGWFLQKYRVESDVSHVSQVRERQLIGVEKARRGSLKTVF
jgi:sorting nexin-8